MRVAKVGAATPRAPAFQEKGSRRTVSAELARAHLGEGERRLSCTGGVRCTPSVWLPAAPRRAPGSKYSTALAGQRALARLESQLMEQTKAVRAAAAPGTPSVGGKWMRARACGRS